MSKSDGGLCEVLPLPLKVALLLLKEPPLLLEALLLLQRVAVVEERCRFIVERGVQLFLLGWAGRQSKPKQVDINSL